MVEFLLKNGDILAKQGLIALENIQSFHSLKLNFPPNTTPPSEALTSRPMQSLGIYAPFYVWHFYRHFCPYPCVLALIRIAKYMCPLPHLTSRRSHVVQQQSHELHVRRHPPVPGGVPGPDPHRQHTVHQAPVRPHPLLCCPLHF